MWTKYISQRSNPVTCGYNITASRPLRHPAAVMNAQL